MGWEGEATEVELLTSLALTPEHLTFANLLTSVFGCLFLKLLMLVLCVCCLFWQTTTPSGASILWSLFFILVFLASTNLTCGLATIV